MPAILDETAKGTTMLEQLRVHYAFTCSDAIMADALVEQPGLFPLLREAVEPMRRDLTRFPYPKIQALQSDEGTILRVLVQLPSGPEPPSARMRRFKNNWWVKNCHRADAGLVFDYEIADGL